MNTKTPGMRLRELREQAGLTQLKLADLSGVHEVNICKMEAGKLPISGKSLLRLARTLKTDPYYLADEKNLPEKLAK
jgi:transcriptional regulator with XRE-family HTH domain